MKKTLIFLTATLMLMMLVTGCSSNDTTATPTASPATEVTQTPVAEVTVPTETNATETDAAGTTVPEVDVTTEASPAA